MRLATCMLAAVAAFMLSGCVIPGQKAYRNDPLTGGVDTATSALLNISVPSGLQYYPSHSSVSGGARKEGLETWRGYVNENACARQFYNRLKLAGWQPRMAQTSGGRAIYIYAKNDEMAAIVFQAQGMLSIVQIWAGLKLAENADFASVKSQEPLVTLPGEEYGPATEERWGVEEKVLE